MKKNFGLLVLCLAVFLPMLAFAQVAALPVEDFLSQVLTAIKGFGGLSWVGKVAVVVTIVVASMKVSFLNQMFWSKLGKFQASLAPILGLVAGILSAGMNGQLPSLPQALAWMSAGAGAIIMHELLDMIKAIPGVGPMWVTLINIIEDSLGKAK